MKSKAILPWNKKTVKLDTKKLACLLSASLIAEVCVSQSDVKGSTLVRSRLSLGKMRTMVKNKVDVITNNMGYIPKKSTIT